MEISEWVAFMGYPRQKDLKCITKYAFFISCYIMIYGITSQIYKLCPCSILFIIYMKQDTIRTISGISGYRPSIRGPFTVTVALATKKLKGYNLSNIKI